MERLKSKDTRVNGWEIHSLGLFGKLPLERAWLLKTSLPDDKNAVISEESVEMSMVMIMTSPGIKLNSTLDTR